MRPAVLPRAVLGRTDAAPAQGPRSSRPPSTAGEPRLEPAVFTSGERPAESRASELPGGELRADATSSHIEAAREPVTITRDFDNESTTLYQRDEDEAPARPEIDTSDSSRSDEVITARPSQGPDESAANEVITARPEPEPAPAPVPTPSRSGRPSARAQRPSRASSPLFAANQGTAAPDSQHPNDPTRSARAAQRALEPVPHSLRAEGAASPESANDNAVSAPPALDLERLADAELAQALSAAPPHPSAKPRPRARARAGQTPPAPAPRSLPQWARVGVALAAIAAGLIMFSIGVSMGVLRLPPKPGPANPPPSAAEHAAPGSSARDRAAQPSAIVQGHGHGSQPSAAAPPAQNAAPDTSGQQSTTPRPQDLATQPSAPSPRDQATAPQPSPTSTGAQATAPQPSATSTGDQATTQSARTQNSPPQPSAARTREQATAQSPSSSPQPSAAEADVDPARVVARAWAQLRAKDPASAEALVRPLLERDPDDHHAAEVLAHALLAQSKPREALRYIDQIVRKRPKRAAYRVLLGDAKHALSDQEGAIAAWQAALQIEPDNREAKRRLHLE
jgi:hypothetical protein